VQPAGNIQFGAFDLNLETGELRRRGRGVKLSPKPFQVLALLAGSPGKLITRDAIRKELWDSDTFVDFEHALNFCIREVRAALGDSAKKPRYIETLPRRGYRFIAETSQVPGAGASTPAPRGSDDSRQLEAYRHYEAARKSFGLAGKEALEQARQGFERALEISPGYAMAHSGLGAAHALRSLNRRHPQDLDAAQAHLEKALELDPELAEPYPWLCYVLMRKNQVERGLQAGRRGVLLQPDLVHAHYFLGLAYIAATECDSANYSNAVRHLLDAARTGPQWQPTWFVLSYAALLLGDYERAEEYAGRLLEMNRAPKGLPFIGAEIVLGSVKLRQGDPAAARGLLLSFLERMTASDHMYRDAMSGAAACALGDVELRHGNSAEALAAYRRAWHTVQENPRIMAYQRIAARAQAGLAAAYAAHGDRARARELLGRAMQAARDSELPEHNAAAASLAELYWAMAVGCARIGDGAETLEMVRSAVRTGWRDAAWMEQDPELRVVRGEPEFRQLVEEVRRAPKVRFDESRAIHP
jgi:DNA-binding winged helix-turn-helix (wHTH) protein/Flp pilus assembly protein TadD